MRILAAVLCEHAELFCGEGGTLRRSLRYAFKLLFLCLDYVQSRFQRFAFAVLRVNIISAPFEKFDFARWQIKIIAFQDDNSMERPKIVWIDMTITTRHSEVDAHFLESFDIRYGSVPNLLQNELDIQPGEALAFEFDYPDRPGLSLLRRTKQSYPRVPILMLTAQHSEKLAVWAYRNQVIDYLVTPVTQADMVRCRQLLHAVQNADQRQTERTIIEYQSSIPVEVPVGQRVRSVRLAASLHFVQTNFRRMIRIAEVAEQCDMSSFHFSHEFTEAFSLTFQEYLLRYRILEACKELRHPNIAVANVAYSVGFNDPSYFARVFRRYFGLSPSEYCEKVRQGDHEVRLQELMEKLELPALESKNTSGDREGRRQTDMQRRHVGGSAKY